MPDGAESGYKGAKVARSLVDRILGGPAIANFTSILIIARSQCDSCQGGRGVALLVSYTILYFLVWGNALALTSAVCTVHEMRAV